MRPEAYPGSRLGRISRSIYACALGYGSGKGALDEGFRVDLSSLRGSEIEGLARIIDANRVTIPVYEAVRDADSPAIRRLEERLKPKVKRIEGRKLQRDALLRRLTEVLDHNDIDYALFKTLNRLGSVGVDVDLIIHPSSYDTCVEALLANGFYSIDDLSKRYATGFMVRGNPIIVDLHTELAVLGVNYMSSDLLLKSSRKIMFQPCDCSDKFPLWRVNDTMDALVRMAHCVFKEWVITIDDVAEISHVFPSKLDLIVRYIDRENIRLAASSFSYIALQTLGAVQLKSLIMFEEAFAHNFAKKILTNFITNSHPPFKLPFSVSMIAFIDHLKKRGEIIKYMPQLLSSIRFQRNASHLGKKVIERFMS